jgi:hypothetical protein
LEGIGEWDGTAWGLAVGLASLVIGVGSVVVSILATRKARSADRAAQAAQEQLSHSRLVGALGRLDTFAAKLVTVRLLENDQFALAVLGDWRRAATEVAALVRDSEDPVAIDLVTSISGSHGWCRVAREDIEHGKPVAEATARFYAEVERVMALATEVQAKLEQTRMER